MKREDATSNYAIPLLIHIQYIGNYNSRFAHFFEVREIAGYQFAPDTTL